MAEKVRDVMTADPATLGRRAPVTEAARVMRDSGVGDVLVVDDDMLYGVVTDRDIVVRGVAEARDPGSTTVEALCSSDIAVVAPDDDVKKAVRLMRERAVRRLPVVDDDRLVGVVSIGDLAVDRDPGSALADISASSPNE
ncbi:CBS domain-containing protein [Allonocardiopsis opalescens]|uniref:CBS domain protein n=1 Tax=Allonocardiopsis opalescens TaxID=1144618 RepID=A0A2T0PXR0_9ACTN|nr:CBS domain-containing protein [Allonocardiopsis opalescens]PRX96186.1 CBS domain protein [Allonocardiopsis opalescens]